MERRDLLASVGIPTPDHLVLVIEENHSYDEIIGSPSAPYINSLANGPAGALFTQSFAVEHPSQPNYLDLFSGLNQGVTSSNLPANLPFTTTNLGAELLAKGRTFVGYSEDLPSVGFDGTGSGSYVRRHNPWVNWQDSSSNGIPVADNQPFTSFPSDFSALPTVSIVVPNLNDDMHDGSISAGDTWLQSHLDAYAQWATTHNSLLIVTFDEDDGSQANRVTTLFVGSMLNHAQYSEIINHFGVLRTIEDMYGLAYAGASSTAPAITDAWRGNSGTFVQQGSVLNVTGTSGDDQIVLAFDPNNGARFSVSVNNASNSYDTSIITEVSLQGGTGSDKVVITDPVNAFSASLLPNSGTIVRTGFEVKVSGAPMIYVYGNSKSTAQLFDAPTGAFVSSPTYGYVSGSGFFDMAVNFGSLYGYAGGNSDVASLYSAGGDSFVATAAYAYTADPVHQEFFNVAVGFYHLYGYGSSSGTDTAYLYSAAGDWFAASSTYSYLVDPLSHRFFDLASGFRTVYAYASTTGTDTAFLYAAAGGLFVASPTSSYLTGANYFAAADDFRTVYGFSSGTGTDVAFFYAAANTIFVGAPTESYLSTGGTLIVANGFKATYGYATPGLGATADLFDSADDDSLVASGNTATLFAALGTYYSANGFDAVLAHRSTGNDTEHVDTVFFRFEKSGTWRDI